MSEPEFSRTVAVDTIGRTVRAMRVEAAPDERSALARRLGLAEVARLEAALSLTRLEEDIVASGRINADVVQNCVVNGEPVAARVAQDFAVRFRQHPEVGAADVEIELAADELDVMFIDGALIDIGEAVAQTLALNLDPYPRSASAADALARAGEKEEGEAGPFAALAGLRDKLGG